VKENAVDEEKKYIFRKEEDRSMDSIFIDTQRPLTIWKRKDTTKKKGREKRYKKRRDRKEYVEK